GTFDMGGGDPEQNSDALPIHRVSLTEEYYIAEEPVTVEQFSVFLKEKYGKSSIRDSYRGYLQGVSYEEAAEYAVWLTETEGKPYHLPTEAQWEYAARQVESIPLDRMCDRHIREWCYDWFAPFGEDAAEDPAGPVNGNFRCVRGGYLDNPKRYNAFPLEPYFRGALPAGYRHYEEDKQNDFGRHSIGFRVVMSRMPKPSGMTLPYYLSVGVKQDTKDYRKAAPPTDLAYFRKRYLFPVPPDNCTQDEIQSTGFSSNFRHHHHSPGFTAAPNGDLLYSVYSTYHEYDAESGLAGLRFRIGEDQWGLPDMFLNPVGVNDHAPLFHTGTDGKIYHFWGWPQMDHVYPFQYVVSEDNGEHWSDVQFPLFSDKAEFVSEQPINSCIDALDGTFYLASDASASMMTDDTGVQRVGATSVLWRSLDGKKTWENPKSRTVGRHTTAVELKDGSILALGGKNTDIDGYMPGAITKDGGDSYCVFRTCFPALNSGQRPSVLRLASGKLLLCGDYQTKKNLKPADMQDRQGSYVAWSEDEGQTWNFKQLWGTQKRKETRENGAAQDLFGGASTLGYSVMKQSPDGLIHIVCSNVHPLLHLCFNETWLLSKEEAEPDERELMSSKATMLVTPRKEYVEYYEGGGLKCRYFGGVADDGRFLLDGSETFWYQDGTVMWEACYCLGKRVGIFTYFDNQGNPVKRITYP
ncbi:MAG: SUMF1/EgtB/PvdO family nonheme iron enzyme, partial [Hungatella sp.]